MGKIIRCITSDGTVMAVGIDSTDIVNEAVRIHETSAVVSAALGRLLTAASMMGINLSVESEAPPIRPPSTFALESKAAAFAPFIEPPY
jgi:molecular chaperone Hsp33